MKKLLCAFLAIAAVLSLAACSSDPSDDVTTKAPTTYAWPDNAFFKDIPAIKDSVTLYNEEKNDQGYTYTFHVADVDYKEFCEYIANLEKSEFEIYSTSPLNTTTTKDLLPDELPDGTYNASWLGKRRGVYVAASWYGDEYYEANNLPQDNNLRIVFYTYNPF